MAARVRFFCAVLAASLAASSAAVIAQVPGVHSLEASGTLEAVRGNVLEVKTPMLEIWHVQIDPQAKVQVNGTAELDYLRPGLAVRFSGEIDKKGNLQGEVKDLEIFTPRKGDLGLFETGAAEDAKPVRNAGAGSYQIRGKISKLKDGEITVTAGKKVTGKLASDAKVTVNVSEVTYAQPGDGVKVQGQYNDPNRPNAERRIPGRAIASEVSITLAKPLVSKFKKPASSPRTPRPKRSKEAPPDEGGAIRDPFGGDAPK